MAGLIDVGALINDVTERYCKDCERRKGIKNGKRKVIYDIGDAPCRACAVYDMIDALENAPRVDPVKHGHWEVVDGTEPRRYGCSVCKRLSWTEDNYCSYCGAKMDEVEDV